ncbi:hypothetical protein GN956_G3892 [Arapaima gigas]
MLFFSEDGFAETSIWYGQLRDSRPYFKVIRNRSGVGRSQPGHFTSLAVHQVDGAWPLKSNPELPSAKGHDARRFHLFMLMRARQPRERNKNTN